MPRPAILVVEDEPAIRGGVCDALTFHGMAPTGVGDGREGLRQAVSGRFELVMLDVMLPGLDGFSILRELRKVLPRQAVLMLTAKGAESDVLEGFACGADDYVGKPFSVAQLIARVEALLRRAGRPEAPAQAPFAIAGIRIDPAALAARRGDAVAELNRRDVQLLALLASRSDQVVGRAVLLEAVWGFARGDEIETRCVDMHLVKLRRKLAEAFGVVGERLIETVRGEGYRVRAGPEAAA